MVRWGAALVAAVSLCAYSPVAAQAASDETLWELSPYKVHVVLALAPGAAAAGDLATTLPPAIEARAWGVIGSRWQCTVAVAPLAVREAIVYGFDKLTAEQLVAAVPQDCDKLFVTRLSYGDGCFTIDVRDFDVHTQMLSAPATAEVFQRTRLADAIQQTVLAAFAPLARVEEVKGDEVTLRLRGRALPLRDSASETSLDKAIFRPVIRLNDRDGKARRIQLIDWTYLVAEEIDEAHIQARLVTGLRTPLVSRRRGRTEQWALYVHVPPGPTTLALRSTDKTPHPLVGYQVYSHPVGVKETQWLGTTDARGDLRIEPGDGGVRVLLIKSGNAIMARLPLLPGVNAVATAQMPDDQRRLQVEGLINGFQEELVDLIARRQVLMARVRSRLDAGKTEEARALFNELRRLRSQQDLARQLLVERQRRASDDPRLQRQIDKLFDDTQTVINRYLDSRPLDRLERELAGETTAQAEPPPAPAAQ